MYEVIPLKGVGSILLGMSREESRAAIGVSPRTFKKSFNSLSLTDAYDFADTSFHLYFDKNEMVEYIELSSSGTSLVTYKGISVFETEADDLIKFISQDASYDDNDFELGYSFIFPSLELSVWRPVLPESSDDEEGRYFSTIGLGRKGYYSEGAI